METPELLQWGASLGVGGVLAAFMFVWSKRLDQQRQIAQEGTIAILVKALTENTAALVALKVYLEEREERR